MSARRSARKRISDCDGEKRSEATPTRTRKRTSEVSSVDSAAQQKDIEPIGRSRRSSNSRRSSEVKDSEDEGSSKAVIFEGIASRTRSRCSSTESENLDEVLEKIRSRSAETTRKKRPSMKAFVMSPVHEDVCDTSKTVNKSERRNSLSEKIASPSSKDANATDCLLKVSRRSSSKKESSNDEITTQTTPPGKSSEKAESSINEISSATESKNDKEHSLWPKLAGDALQKDLVQAYMNVRAIDSNISSISDHLITSDCETIWQQIAYTNRKFTRHYSKNEKLFSYELEVKQRGKLERSASTFDKMFSDSKENSISDADDESENEDEIDLFNLTEKQIKHLEADSESDSENEEDMESEKKELIDASQDSAQKPIKWKRSVVDDHVFSNAEMQNFLDQQDKLGDQPTNFLEQFDKDDDAEAILTDYRYADFYGEVSETDGKSEKKLPKKALENVDDAGKRRKSVRFVDEVESDDGSEDDLSNSEADNGGPVLFGQSVEDEMEETEFQKRQKMLQEKISKLEKINLAPRAWNLSGEVTALDRDENTVLEQQIDFDQSASCPPVITVDVTAQLEAMIIQRIKDNAFDDVVRIVRDRTKSTPYRAQVIEEDSTQKSLAEVYEEQYQKVQHGDQGEKKNEKHLQIESMMKELFKKFDALTHFRYNPPEVQEEIRIINNMASLQKEEVGPTASTNEVLLAPEEVHKHVAGVVKGEDEKTKTDRSRAHRKKKKWLRERQKMNERLSSADSRPSAVKKQKLSSKNDSQPRIKSNFFQKLQETSILEVNLPKKKDRTERVKSSSAYKL